MYLASPSSWEHAHKPVGICGVSSGPWGGARMVGQLRWVCIAFHMVPTCEAVYFPKVQELFNEDGSINGQSQYRQAERLLAELIWYANALKREREKGIEP